MKKFLIKISTLIIIFALTLSLAGCSLFTTVSTPQEESPTPQTPVSLNKTEFGRIDGTREAKNKVEVISNVRRSVVSVIMSSAAGTSAGSGVIVDMNVTKEDGTPLDTSNDFYILTCHHVIDSAGTVVVYLPDAENDNFGESDYDLENYAFEGEIGGGIHADKAVTLIGGDKKSDVALLKLTISNPEIASKITKAKFPPSENYEMVVGEDIIAIGNPTGSLPGTVSFGTISYLNRETAVGDVGELTLMQINADIYHGSSGGGIFNMYGELIGLAGSGREGYVLSDTTIVEYGGLNFVIPYVVDKTNGDKDFGFENVAGLLLASKTETNYGYVPGRVSYFGFTTVQTETNVQVTSVTPGSIAANSNIKEGDLIIKAVKGTVDKLATAEQVTKSEQVTSVFNSLVVGDNVSLSVVHAATDSSVQNITMEAVQYIFCNTGN